MGNMTLAEMETIAAKAREIRAAQEKLRLAQQRLALLRKNTVEKKGWKEETFWRPTLVLSDGDAYGYGRVTFDVNVPFAVVMQQVIDEVRAAERAVILAGGMP